MDERNARMNEIRVKIHGGVRQVIGGLPLAAQLISLCLGVRWGGSQGVERKRRSSGESHIAKRADEI